MRRLLVAGNWKMNASVAMTEHLLSAIRDAEIDTCDVPVFPQIFKPSIFQKFQTFQLSNFKGIYLSNRSRAYSITFLPLIGL